MHPALKSPFYMICGLVGVQAKKKLYTSVMRMIFLVASVITSVIAECTYAQG